MAEKKTALITGVTGQDGSYLADLLLEKGYTVHGLARRFAPDAAIRIKHLMTGQAAAEGRFQAHECDVSDQAGLRRLLEETVPDEVYHLAAQSHVRVSFDMPVHTVEVTGLGTLRLLESLRDLQRAGGKVPRFYQASSSEMFGAAKTAPQREDTPFHPRSPYGCAKCYAHWQTLNYREAYGLFACSGILFNHESPRRGENFVTRKITRAATRIKLGLQKSLGLGDLDAQRDWGFAGDYVDAMWRMLQQAEPKDYVIATGETHSVREFCAAAFGRLGLDWEKYVEYDAKQIRPAEVVLLLGDAGLAKRELGWEPKVHFKALVEMMVDADLKLAEAEAAKG